MSMRYTKVSNSYEAKVEGGYLYVRTTGCNNAGVLVQGERVWSIYRMPYKGTLENVIYRRHDDPERYIDAIDRCMMAGAGEEIKKGRLIR